ncbi:acyl-CoA-binding protein [Maribacter algarum]|uniref:Acyl-CoA-binding protein n=1 Tax=Maribacter algarum (ex Zhang et al. 2020) TaxID=2578118 RepID=A0A5S3PNN8_9FLAO|nr:acyl-CoA-binding protein [Maribacter algarum]TMM56092.1 acyl-CoA-binding protein [Maribacter algarum]
MKGEKLKKDFKAAVEYVNTYTEPLPADLLLKLYAYYKIAKKNKNHPGSRTPLINAFKANALIQAKNIGREKAMKEYVKLVKKEIKTS